MDFLSYKKIHYVGIGGIGVSALARLSAASGASVSGSDQADFEDKKDLEAKGITIFIGHAAENIPDTTEAVVYSSAIPPENPELLAAKEKNLPTLEYVEALGLLMQNSYGIAVSGTNGKTTTTAILGKILEKAGWDPLVVVGGKVPGWQGNLRLPVILPTPQNKKDFPMNIFVAEACEYRANMLKLAPKMIVLTNIEEDHLDYFGTMEKIEETFTEYIKKLPSDGILVYNADDPVSVKIIDKLEESSMRKVSYSLERDADARASDHRYEQENQIFKISWDKQSIDFFSLAIPGKFNVSNTLAAAAAALALEVPPEPIRAAVKEFHGTWRRFEKLGKIKKKPVISDYAHHPTGIKSTIRAAKELYPNKKLLVVFQPHQKDRTRRLLADFATAFIEADCVILTEIYRVAGREEEDDKTSAKDLLLAMRKINENPPVGLEDSFETAEKRIREILDSYDVILVMGAGDIYKFAETLVDK